MSIGEVYSLKIFGTLLGQQWLNTFAYRQVAGAAPSEAADLAERFDATIALDLSQLAGSYCTYERIEAFAIDNPVDYAELIPTVPFGGRTFTTAGTPPSYTAYGFRSNRAGAGTRASYKRFCGIGETDVTANTLDPTFMVLVAASNLQAALGNLQIHSSGNSFQPVQLKSGWILGVPPIQNFDIFSWGLPYLTSQVSRRL